METNLKLTVDQLKNYLGTGLKLYMDYDEESYVDVLTGVIDDHYFTEEGEGDDYEIKGIKPYFFRLSDLDKFIPELGFVPYEEMRKQGNWCDAYDEYFDIAFEGEDLNQCPFEIVQQFIKWNFWVFDQSYFEQGLIIDKLTHGKEAKNA